MPRGFINALDWAFGDGSNDDANALNQAGAAANSATKNLWVPRTANAYDIGSTVTIPAGVWVIGYGKIRVKSGFTKTQPAIEVGSSGVANSHVKIELLIDNQAAGSSVDWTSGSYVGVRLHNISHSEIRLRLSRGFAIGLELVAAAGQRCWNNRIFLGLLEDCQYAVQLDGQAGNVQDNNLFMGRHAISSAASSARPDTERELWRILGTGSDGNHWTSPSSSIPRGSSQGTRKLAYLHTQSGQNQIENLGDGAALSVADGDAHLVADGASASHNLVHIGRWGGQAKTVVKINGAPNNVNGVITRRDEIARIAVLGGELT